MKLERALPWVMLAIAIALALVVVCGGGAK
jgi:hypothetical protein